MQRGERAEAQQDAILDLRRGDIIEMRVGLAYRAEVRIALLDLRPAGPSNPVHQSVLGLPLLNNYYTVFDRSGKAGRGVIKFAAIKRQ